MHRVQDEAKKHKNEKLKTDTHKDIRLFPGIVFQCYAKVIAYSIDRVRECYSVTFMNMRVKKKAATNVSKINARKKPMMA